MKSNVNFEIYTLEINLEASYPFQSVITSTCITLCQLPLVMTII